MEKFKLIRSWAKAKGIYDSGDPKTQYIKLQEEAGELAKALLKNDKPEIIDALGDCVVVLVNLAELCGYKLEDCVDAAYDVIKSRTGKMQNGTFVKSEKPVIIAKKHANGYYNLPCQYKEINSYLETSNIQVGDKIYGSNDDLHLVARPSLTEGGCAYVKI